MDAAEHAKLTRIVVHHGWVGGILAAVGVAALLAAPLIVGVRDPSGEGQTLGQQLWILGSALGTLAGVFLVGIAIVRKKLLDRAFARDSATKGS